MKTNIKCAIFFTLLILGGRNLFGQIKGSGECIYVLPSSMNILYIGVDNPIQIYSRFISDSVTVTGCGIKHINGKDYSARPELPGVEKLLVILHNGNDSTIYDYEFRIRRIPDPYVYVGNSKSGQLKLKMFKAFKDIVIKNPDFPYQLPYQLKSFEMTWISTEGKILKDSTDNKNFTEKMIAFQTEVKPGDFIIINAIIIMPDGRTVPIVGAYNLIEG